MAFLKLTGHVASFAETMMPKYSQVDDLLIIDGDGRKTTVSMLHMRTDMLLALQQAQADGSMIELFIDRRPKLIGRHQLFGLKTENVALFDRSNPSLGWSAIPTAMVLAVTWLISIQFFYSHFDLVGFLFAMIMVQMGMVMGSMLQFVPLSMARVAWLLANRLDRKKLFYGDAGESARTKALEPSTI